MLIPPKFCCSSCANTSPSSLPTINNSVACATILATIRKEYRPDLLNNLAFYMDFVTKKKTVLPTKSQTLLNTLLVLVQPASFHYQISLIREGDTWLRKAEWLTITFTREMGPSSKPT